MEQTKFTYPPLSKAFEKQIKTVEDQIFDEPVNERIGELPNLSKQINFNSLIYYFKAQIGSKRFFDCSILKIHYVLIRV